MSAGCAGSLDSHHKHCTWHWYSYQPPRSFQPAIGRDISQQTYYPTSAMTDNTVINFLFFNYCATNSISILSQYNIDSSPCCQSQRLNLYYLFTVRIRRKAHQHVNEHKHKNVTKEYRLVCLNAETTIQAPRLQIKSELSRFLPN
jgi:hypothetical protein